MYFIVQTESKILRLICPPSFHSVFIAGIRAFHPDGDPGDVVGGLGDGSRLHLRHQEAAAHDHLRRGEGADTGEGCVEITAAATDRVFAERLESSKGGVDSNI